MRIALGYILEHLREQGADDDRLDRVRHALPALVETRDYAETLRELEIDVDALTRSDIPGPTPDDHDPERTGPVGAPNTALADQADTTT